MTLTMKLVQLRAGARGSVQGQLSDKDTEKLINWKNYFTQR